MAQYAPLPPIELDPRSESELVAASARRVYESSNGTINDFASGSPVVALLEGQAFAQAEFLHFANQFPDAVLVEWIGPFLGAQRRTGAGAVVQLQVTIDERPEPFVVFPGYEVATDPNLTGGVAIGFVTTERLEIPVGETSGMVNATALFRGANTNVPAGSITEPMTSLAGVASVTNPELAYGGEDPELLSEVKERFFSLIRRRNPVSSEDWLDFFTDALGPGTACTVLPRRSEKEVYRYADNYVNANPSVSFFLLNPDGSPISKAQQDALQNLIKWSLPTEFLGFVYPMEVDDVDVTIKLSYDQSKPYAQNLRSFTRTVRDDLFSVMTPNAIFPINYNYTVGDLEGALTNTFPQTLGVNNAYVDPDVIELKTYYPPKNLAISAYKQTTPTKFISGNSIITGDLLIDDTGTAVKYYPALQDFTPATNNVTYFVNTGDLELEIIQPLVAGTYASGDVVYVSISASIHVVLTSFSYDGRMEFEELIANGFISGPKDFAPWGAASYSPFDDDGNYDPQVIGFDPSFTGFNTYSPQTPEVAELRRRPGYPVLVVENAFTVSANTTDLGQAQNQGLVSENQVYPNLLTIGKTYLQGQYFKTPNPQEILSTQVLQDVCYVSQVLGGLQVYAEVLKEFTFTMTDGVSYATTIDSLESEGFIKIVRLVPFIDCNGTANFAQKPFRYTARFATGEYVRYRESGGFSSDELEECLRQTNTCGNVTSACKRLLEDQLPLPRYFYVLKDFTPYTQDIQTMIDDEVIQEVDRDAFIPNYKITLSRKVYYDGVTPEEIDTALIAQDQIVSKKTLTVGQTVEVLNADEVVIGAYYWSGTSWVRFANGMPTFRDMFRFAPGDVAGFRNGSQFRNYEATTWVTPILDLEVYFDNGVFKRTTKSGTVLYFDPTYRIEDICFAESSYSSQFFRAIKSFTPSALIESWAGEVDNTARIEEVYRNLLKFTALADCNNKVYPRLSDGAATTKLGTANIQITAKSTGSPTETFVWESTVTLGPTPELSFTPTTTFPYEPVDYGNGTLAL